MENRQKIWQRRGFLPVVMVIALVALAPKLFTQQIEAAARGQNTEWYQVVEGSIYDGDTLRVTRGGQELKVSGIDAPELQQDMGIEAQDHLRSLKAMTLLALFSLRKTVTRERLQT